MLANPASLCPCPPFLLQTLVSARGLPAAGRKEELRLRLAEALLDEHVAGSTPTDLDTPGVRELLASGGRGGAGGAGARGRSRGCGRRAQPPPSSRGKGGGWGGGGGCWPPTSSGRSRGRGSNRHATTRSPDARTTCTVEREIVRNCGSADTQSMVAATVMHDDRLHTTCTRLAQHTTRAHRPHVSS